MPGMPGTGLGGIFYALLILWITVRELWRLARGVSGSSNWHRIGELAAILAGIIAVFWGVGWLIKAVADATLSGGAAMPKAVAAQNKAIEALIPSVALLPILILAFLIGGLHLLRLVLRWRAT